jgi:hypothetical protein
MPYTYTCAGIRRTAAGYAGTASARVAWHGSEADTPYGVPLRVESWRYDTFLATGAFAAAAEGDRGRVPEGLAALRARCNRLSRWARRLAVLARRRSPAKALKRAGAPPAGSVWDVRRAIMRSGLHGRKLVAVMAILEHQWTMSSSTSRATSRALSTS